MQSLLELEAPCLFTSNFGVAAQRLQWQAGIGRNTSRWCLLVLTNGNSDGLAVFCRPCWAEVAPHRLPHWQDLTRKPSGREDSTCNATLRTPPTMVVCGGLAVVAHP